ncbi:MAG: 1-(5-phosphoribosyl)-5-[(5-phosphoribosylamino)methylideneamino]imidazole-4-carboxamide isomerase [Bacillota bacterium]
MLLLPAIDIREGYCVRLYQGDLDAATVFSEDPVEVALKWQGMGAKMLHVVDLDGAFSGSPKNLDVVKEIVSSLKIPVQFGGGVRSLDIIDELMSIGISRVVIGTAAISNPDLVREALLKYGNEAILIGIDSKYGKVAVEGWETLVEKSAVDLALEMKNLGIKTIVYTDIRRDGTLQGVNLDGLKDFTEAARIKVIASGGVANIEDLKKVKALESLGVEGLIIGKALYTGDIDLSEGLRILEN